MKHVLLFILIMAVESLLAQPARTVRCLLINSSYQPPRPEKNAMITPLSGGNTVEQGTEAGIFEFKIPGAKPGEHLELLVKKEGYQILGPNQIIFTCNVPEKEDEPVQLAIIKSTDFDSRKSDFEKAIDKRLTQANAELLDSIARLQNQNISKDERTALTKFISQQNLEIENLRKNKDELAVRLAEVDLDQASEFAQLALKKFREEGDVKAALLLIPDEKLDAFWSRMVNQEEKVKRGRKQGVENYMIRARLLIADFQFPPAYENYMEATQKDSTNLENLWEVAYFLNKQNQYQRAITLYEKCLNLAKTGAQRAGLLNNLGNLYKDNNRMTDAEKAYIEALEGYRILEEKSPEVFLPSLGMALNNLGILYKSNQKMLKAEKAFNEALSIRRELAEKKPDTFEPDLGETLNNIGVLFSNNLRMTEAEKVYSEALSIRRKLAQKKPDVYLSDLAGTLNNLGVFYAANQNMNEAKKAYDEALGIQKKLVEKNPDAYLSDLAKTLNNLGVFYVANQKMAEAENAYCEALNIRRQLVEKNPNAFLPDMAITLTNLANLCTNSQRISEAERFYVEALNIQRKLTDKYPEAFHPALAMTLHNMGRFYMYTQKMLEAEKAFNEALVIRNKLTDENPNVFQPDLAATLNSLGVYYITNQKMLDAERVYNEALSIRRKLAEKNPDAFQSALAETLNSLGIYYSTNQKMTDAENAYNEALDKRRKLAEKNPEIFLSDLATTLNNFGVFYKDNLKIQEAGKVYNEALSIRRKLAEKNPNIFLPDLATTLNNLGIYYKDAQMAVEAEKAYEEALNIRKELANKNPDAFQPYVATTLNNLGVFYTGLEQFSKALDHYEEALHIRQAELLAGQGHFSNEWKRVLRNITWLKDSTKANQQYTMLVRAGLLLAHSCDSLRHLDPNIKNQAAFEYGNLSWWAVFAKDYELAEQAGVRCLALDDRQIVAWTNIGHAHWLSGKEQDAYADWLHLKGKMNDEKPYDIVLKEDWEALEKANVVPIDAFEKAKKWLSTW